MKIEGHLLKGYSLVFSGSLETGLKHLEIAVADFKPGLQDSHKFRFGNNPGIISYITSALCWWMMGFPDRSMNLINDAIALADRINHISTKAYVNFHSGLLHLWKLEPELALKKAEAVLEISDKNEFQIWKAVAKSLHGASLVGTGKTKEGLREIEFGMEMYSELKTPPVFWPMLLSLRAVTAMMVENPDEGLKYIEEALDLSDEKSGNPILAESYRLKGEILLMISTENTIEAEALFRLAIHISKKQKTKMFELRAAMSLYRLLTNQGKSDEGREFLSEAYNKFTEGFSTVDLIEAKKILESS
jgi:tetratricopeptide (TPR) repeat protein